MSTPIPTTPDAKEQARIEREAMQTRAEARITNAERFGWPHEQAADREANIASLPPEVQARIRAEDAARCYAVRIVGSAVVLPVRAVFFDNTTRTLTIGVDLPKGYGRTEDEEQAPYTIESAPGLATPDLAALAAKLPDEEPLAIVGQGDTARHINP